MRDAREEVCEDAEAVCSVRIVLLWAMHELRRDCQSKPTMMMLMMMGREIWDAID